MSSLNNCIITVKNHFVAIAAIVVLVALVIVLLQLLLLFYFCVLYRMFNYVTHTTKIYDCFTVF